VHEQLESAWKLDGISPRAYQHPADRAATAALQKVPYLDQVVRKLVALGYERALRTFALGASVRLGQNQLPHIWVLHRQVFNTLDMERVPSLYMTQFPFANAAAIGVEKPIVVVNSELIRILDEDGRRVVLAHEAAHVHSDHVLYQTALIILLRLGTSVVRLPLLAGLPLLAIQLALLEWFRAAELSCDRAAALVTRDPNAVCRALMTMSAGEAADDLNLDAFIAQAMDYDTGGSGLERLTKLMQDLQLTHPMPVRRVRMLLDWVHEGGYDRMVRGEYLRVGQESTLREEADAATEYYSERIAGAFQQAGSSIADAGQQFAEWLKKTRSQNGEEGE
jgi:Zn-dependent protease with chaperone function